MANEQAKALLADPSFWQQPEAQRIEKLSSIDQDFKAFSPENKAKALKLAEPKYRKTEEPPSPLRQIGTSLKNAAIGGLRTGLAVGSAGAIGGRELVEGLIGAQVEQAKKAKESYGKKDYLGAAESALGAAVPLYGPLIQQTAEKATEGKRPYEAFTDLALSLIPLGGAEEAVAERAGTLAVRSAERAAPPPAPKEPPPLPVKRQVPTYEPKSAGPVRPPLRAKKEITTTTPPPTAKDAAARPPTQTATKPLWEMSPEELDQAKQSASKSDREELVEAFGEEGAKRYQRLERTANSTTKPEDITSKAYDELTAMEEKLTEEQRNKLYGIGGEDRSSAESIQEYRRALGSLDWSSPEDLGNSLKWAVTKVGEKENPAEMTPSEQVAYSTLRHAMQESGKIGWDPLVVSQSALKAASKRFSPEDAAFMLRRYGRTTNAQPPPVGELPPPSTTPPPTAKQEPPPPKAEASKAEETAPPPTAPTPPPAGGPSKAYGEASWTRVSDIKADPKRFQFKHKAIGKGGTTDKLRDVETFDPLQSGSIAVWRDPKDGNLYVVNGHHRLELAQRTDSPYISTVEIPAKTAEEARTKGALINIGEGNGDPIDAARVFKQGGMDAKYLNKLGISPKSTLMKQGLALAKLIDPILDMVGSGDIEEGKGAVIGELLSNPAQQKAAVELLKKAKKRGKKLDDAEFREAIRLQVERAPIEKKTQSTLFGDEETERSYALELGEISSYIKDQIATEKRLFGTVGKQGVAQRLGETGNVIQAEANKARSEQAAQVQHLYDKLSGMSGPVSEALDAAAKELADGRPAREVKDRAYERVRAALESDLSQIHAGRTGSTGAGVPGVGEQGSSAPPRPREIEPDLFSSQEPPGIQEPPNRRSGGGVSTNADKILAAMQKLEPEHFKNGVPITVSRLRKALPDMTEDEFNQAALELRKQQKVFLPLTSSRISAEAEGQALIREGDKVYGAIATRESAPDLFASQEPPK